MAGNTHGKQSKHSRLTLAVALVGAAILPFFGLACGVVLGLDDPTDRPLTMMITPPEDGATGCLDSEKMCSGICVHKNDPEFGCGVGDCVACPSPQNATASCVPGGCGFTECHKGFGDCDVNTLNGCETQLTSKTACGDCKTDCTKQTPPQAYCTPSGGGVFSCTNTCSQPYVVCPKDGECADTTSDVRHCGPTCADCTTANGTGTCDNGVCTLVCDTAYCQQGNLCVSSDNAHCFSASPKCSACVGGQVCGNAGAMGCVTPACTPDPTHCGPTCTACGGGGHCTGGGSCVCTVPQNDSQCGVDCNINCLSSGQVCDTLQGICVTPALDASIDNFVMDTSVLDGPPAFDACFVAGTPITLADGKTKAIEEIEVGDEVLSFDTATGRDVPGKVVRLFVHPHTRRLARLNGIVTTPEHRFYANGAWVAAGELSVGDALTTLARAEPDGRMLVTDRANELLLMSGDTTTYNFEVAVFHDYFASRYLVHNVKGPLTD